MKKTNRRFLAYAVAIAASFAAVPGITQAEPVEAPQAEASVDNGTVAQETTAPAAEADIPDKNAVRDATVRCLSAFRFRSIIVFI